MPVPRPSHVAVRLLPSWMICSTNQGRAYFEFQMLAGKSQAGIWALGNIQEENGFVLSLCLSPSHPWWGASVGPLCPVALQWALPSWHSPRKPSTYLSTFWGVGMPGATPLHGWGCANGTGRGGMGGSVLGAQGHGWQRGWDPLQQHHDSSERCLWGWGAAGSGGDRWTGC